VLHIPEDSANGLVTDEPFGQGKQIVLQGRDRGCGKLRSEVPGLALAHSQQSLGFLEEDLEGPVHGIDPIGFQELQGEVGRHYSIPRLLFSLHEIETYICARKANVSGNVLTAKLAAPFAFTSGFKQIDQCPGGELLVAHAEVVLLAFLPEDGEVEDELALAIGNAQQERFETEDRPVSQVGIDPADVFNTPFRLGKVGIVHHKAHSLMLVGHFSREPCSIFEW